MNTLDLNYEFYFRANPQCFDYTHSFQLQPSQTNINTGQITLSAGTREELHLEAIGRYKLEKTDAGYCLHISDLMDVNVEKKLPDYKVNFTIQMGTFCLLDTCSADNHLDPLYLVATKKYVFDMDPLDPTNTNASEKEYYTACSTKTRRELLLYGVQFESKDFYSFVYDLKRVSPNSKADYPVT
jgi:hypothetical protein